MGGGEAGICALLGHFDVRTGIILGRADTPLPVFIIASVPLMSSWTPIGGTLASVSSGLSNLDHIYTWEAGSSLSEDTVNDETWDGQWNTGITFSIGQRSF